MTATQQRSQTELAARKMIKQKTGYDKKKMQQLEPMLTRYLLKLPVGNTSSGLVLDDLSSFLDSLGPQPPLSTVQKELQTPTFEAALAPLSKCLPEQPYLMIFDPVQYQYSNPADLPAIFFQEDDGNNNNNNEKEKEETESMNNNLEMWQKEFDNILGLSSSSSQSKAPICFQCKTNIYMSTSDLQNRASDEGAAVKYKCQKCGNQFKR